MQIGTYLAIIRERRTGCCDPQKPQPLCPRHLALGTESRGRDLAAYQVVVPVGHWVAGLAQLLAEMINRNELGRWRVPPSACASGGTVSSQRAAASQNFAAGQLGLRAAARGRQCGCSWQCCGSCTDLRPNYVSRRSKLY
jgi:hypothetical protein